MLNKRIERLAEFQRLLRVCPTDVTTRCALALLLEELDLPDEASCHWKRILDLDPNNLKAREGVNRCRKNRVGRPFRSQT
jgi:cytochrome c-type biogenesis protein CcmH/NrfG